MFFIALRGRVPKEIAQRYEKKMEYANYFYKKLRVRGIAPTDSTDEHGEMDEAPARLAAHEIL